MLPTRTRPPCPSAAESGSYQSIAAITVAVAMTGILVCWAFAGMCRLVRRLPTGRFGPTPSSPRRSSSPPTSRWAGCCPIPKALVPSDGGQQPLSALLPASGVGRSCRACAAPPRRAVAPTLRPPTDRLRAPAAVQRHRPAPGAPPTPAGSSGIPRPRRRCRLRTRGTDLTGIPVLGQLR